VRKPKNEERGAGLDNPHPLEKLTASVGSHFNGTATEAGQQADSEFKQDLKTIEGILYKHCEYTEMGDAYIRGRGYDRVFVQEILNDLKANWVWSKPAKEGSK
jgi:hypothetical protein